MRFKEIPKERPFALLVPIRLRVFKGILAAQHFCRLHRSRYMLGSSFPNWAGAAFLRIGAQPLRRDLWHDTPSAEGHFKQVTTMMQLQAFRQALVSACQAVCRLLPLKRSGAHQEHE